MFSTHLCCYLWDLVDEGIDAVLDRLKGEAGVSGITVPLACGPVRQRRVHLGEWPPAFQSAGGIQFQPNASLYAATRIRPVVAGWLKKSNPLAAVAEACSKRNLALRGMIECCRNPAEAERFPAVACKDAFGEPLPDWLCPSNPDVREYLRSLVQDAAADYALAGLELDALSYPQLQPGDEGLDLGEAGWRLAGLCFCESCRQGAARDGLDASAAARSVQVSLEKVFSRGEPPAITWSERLRKDSVLAEYVGWQARQLAALADAVKAVCGCKLGIWTTQPELTAVADTVVVASTVEEARLEPALAGGIQSAGEAARVWLRISLDWHTCRQAADLVRALDRAGSRGVRTVSLCHYGLLPAARLDWVRQAARKAQRDAG